MAKRDKRQQQVSREEQNRNPRICVYCLNRPAENVDHVFARCFFIKPRPNLITVPVCIQCNGGTGDGVNRNMNLDENYARDVFCMEYRAGQHPVAAGLRETVYRSLDHAPGVARSLGNTMRQFDAYTPSGLILPNLTAVLPEQERVDRVLRKIAKGLYFHHVRVPLGRDAVIKPIRLPAPGSDAIVTVVDQMKKFPLVGPVGLGQRDAVMYLGSYSSSRSVESMWLLVFYQAIAYWICTVTPEHAVAQRLTP